MLMIICLNKGNFFAPFIELGSRFKAPFKLVFWPSGLKRFFYYFFDNILFSIFFVFFVCFCFFFQLGTPASQILKLLDVPFKFFIYYFTSIFYLFIFSFYLSESSWFCFLVLLLYLKMILVSYIFICKDLLLVLKYAISLLKNFIMKKSQSLIFTITPSTYVLSETLQPLPFLYSTVWSTSCMKEIWGNKQKLSSVRASCHPAIKPAFWLPTLLGQAAIKTNVLISDFAFIIGIKKLFISKDSEVRL